MVTEGCFRQIEFAGVLRGTPHEAAARALIDFMLSEEFQEATPLNMFVSPALAGAALPPEFIAYTEVPAAPLIIDAAVIEANRLRWTEEWASVVLP